MPQKYQKNASKVIGIQFSVLSPEEIKKNSVAEITSRDTYTKLVMIRDSFGRKGSPTKGSLSADAQKIMKEGFLSNIK